MKTLTELFPEAFTLRFFVLNVILAIALSIIANFLTVLVSRIWSTTWQWLRRNGSNVGSSLTSLSLLTPFALVFLEKLFHVLPPKDISIVMVPLLLSHAIGVATWSFFYELTVGWPRSGVWSWVRLTVLLLWSFFVFLFPATWFWISVLGVG
jgi:hypothetical protein